MTNSENVKNFIKNGDPQSVASDFLHSGVSCIDGEFGEGYSKEHPELLGKFILASALNLVGYALHIDEYHIEHRDITDAFC